MSALDDIINDHGTFAPIPGDMRSDAEVRRMLNLESAARADLAALRKRCEDLDLMLRIALDGETNFCFVEDDIEGTRYWEIVFADCAIETQRLPEGEDRLPILTDEARAALRRAT